MTHLFRRLIHSNGLETATPTWCGNYLQPRSVLVQEVTCDTCLKAYQEYLKNEVNVIEVRRSRIPKIEVTIIVSGPQGGGKSEMISRIAIALRNAGIGEENVTFREEQS